MKTKRTDTAKSIQVAVRMTPDLLKRLDAHVERMREAQPGLEPNRADAIRVLLAEGLEQAEASNNMKRKRQKPAIRNPAKASL